VPDRDPALSNDVKLAEPVALDQTDLLICAPEVIFDAAAVRRQIDEAAQDTSDNSALRAETVRILSAANLAGRAAIADAFAAAPFAARPLTRSYTYLTDGLVTTAHYEIGRASCRERV